MSTEWIYIDKNFIIPIDFLISNDIASIPNRELYVIEIGDKNTDKWLDEYASAGVTFDMIASNAMGAKQYHDIRIRKRTELDNKWDKTKTVIAKLYSAVLIGDK